jgi:hypothetical protein
MTLTDRLIFDDRKASPANDPLCIATPNAAVKIKLGPVGSNSMHLCAERSKKESRVEAGLTPWIFNQLGERPR